MRGDQVNKGRKIFRDSEGRIRTERLMSPASKLYVVEIIDPVLGIKWVLDTQHKVAHMMTPQPLPPAPSTEMTVPASIAAPTAPAQPQPVIKTEQLEQQEVEGVRALGSRTTTTFPDGRQVIGESWVAPDLKILVRSQYGDDLFRLANLARKEPFPSLFRIPADYTVVEEKTTFVVEYQ